MHIVTKTFLHDSILYKCQFLCLKVAFFQMICLLLTGRHIFPFTIIIEKTRLNHISMHLLMDYRCDSGMLMQIEQPVIFHLVSLIISLPNARKLIPSMPSQMNDKSFQFLNSNYIHLSYSEMLLMWPC